MATIADVVLTGTAYQDINTASGLIAGTPLVIQNKGSAFVRIIINPTQPPASSENGFVIEPLKTAYVENETQVVWAKSTQPGDTHISVQQLV